METLSWFIGHVIGRIVLPPTIFLLLIAFGLWYRNKKWGLWLTGSSLALLWLLSTPLVAYSLWGSMTETAVPIAVAQVADLPKQGTIIVILSAGKRSALEYPSGETASPLTVQRARYGAWVAKESGLPLAIAGGRLWGRWSEAALTRSFVETELKQAVTLIEDQGRDTREAAINLVEPLRTMKMDSIVLVTDARHMPRASQAFAAEGFKVIPAPMEVSGERTSLGPGDVIPTASALSVSAAVSHEFLGRIWYWLRSRLAARPSPT